MKILKLAIISVVGLFLLVTVFSLLLPSNVIISRAIDINAPLDSVYPLVSDLSYWPAWMENYASSKTELSSASSKGKGAALKMGEVKVIINESDPKKISATWQSGESRPLPGEFNFIGTDTSGHLTVQWQFNQKVKWYPWEKFASIVSDKALGPFMEKSLDNLKNLAERRQ
jgi:hypothetical protein